MYTDHIKTSDRVDISMSKSTPINWDNAHISRVEAVLENRIILVQAPMKQGHFVRLTANEVCSVRFFTETGKIFYNARIMKFLDEEGFKIVSLKLIGEGEKMQLRDFFRFNCHFPIYYFPLDRRGVPIDASPKEGIVRDIGGGGMRMLSKYLFEPHSLIRAMLQLNEDSIMAFGQVLYRDFLENAEIQHQYRIKFAAMSKIDQDKIIQFIYNEQRKILQRPKWEV